VTSQALKFDVINFVSMFKQVYSKFDKPSTTPIYTTPYLSYTTLIWAHKSLTMDPIRIVLLELL